MYKVEITTLINYLKQVIIIQKRFCIQWSIFLKISNIDEIYSYKYVSYLIFGCFCSDLHASIRFIFLWLSFVWSHIVKLSRAEYVNLFLQQNKAISCWVLLFNSFSCAASVIYKHLLLCTSCLLTVFHVFFHLSATIFVFCPSGYLLTLFHATFLKCLTMLLPVLWDNPLLICL